MSLVNSMDKERVLFYFGDPMCSWCYGFINELTKIKDAVKDKAEFEIVMGGLRPFGEEKINTMKSFLKEHWEHVNEASGLEFNYDILDTADWNYDTEPPSRAVIAVSKIKEDIAFDFFKDVQRMFYFDNLNPSLQESYNYILEKYEIDLKEFDEFFNSDVIKQETLMNFQISQQFGIKGFPSLVLKNGDEYLLLSNGYNTAENIIPILDKILES